MGSQLPAAAEAALAGGWSVLVDATFLRRQERQRMAALAQRWGAGFAILDCQCDPRLAAERIRRRLQNGEDPSEATPAVLEAQLGMREPLAADERPWSLPLAMDQHNAGEATTEAVIARLQQRFVLNR
jgi:predicted kinase